MQTKECKLCGYEKPLTLFARMNKERTKTRAECNECNTNKALNVIKSREFKAWDLWVHGRMSEWDSLFK